MRQFSKQYPVGYYVLEAGKSVSMMFDNLSDVIAGLPDAGKYCVVMEVMRPSKDATVYPLFNNKTRKEMEESMGRKLIFNPEIPTKDIIKINDSLTNTTMEMVLKHIEESSI